MDKKRSTRPASLSFAEVLCEEQQALDGIATWDAKAGIGKINGSINAQNRAALCLSGGGIRSAAFSLGVIQRLAGVTIKARNASTGTAPLLCEFDYLSTVSGGGYIGSWISAWLTRRRKTMVGSTVVEQLNARTDGEEADTIRNLRKNAVYLSPRLHLASPDIWSDIASLVRNLLLNWCVILPAFAIIILGTQLGLTAFVRSLTWPRLFSNDATLFAVVLAFISLGYTALHLPTRGHRKAVTEGFIFFDLFFWLISAVLLMRAVRLTTIGQIAIEPGALLSSVGLDNMHPAALYIVGGAVFYATVWAVTWLVDQLLDQMAKRFTQTGWLSSPQEGPGKQSAPRAADDSIWWLGPLGWTVGGAVAGGCIFALLPMANYASDHTLENSILLLVLGVPAILAVRFIANTTFAAISERLMDTDVNLEWLSEAAAYFQLTALGWVGWVGLVAYGPRVLELLHWDLTHYLALSGGSIGAGALAALIGKNAHTGPLPSLAAKAKQYMSLNVVALAGAAIFGIGLTVSLSRLFDFLFFNDSFIHLKELAMRTRFAALVFLGLVVFCWGASRLVSVNRFSLHGIYRNRLVRTFLGASRTEEERDKTRDSFTDYDGGDNLAMHELWPADAPKSLNNGDWQPLHVVNVTLNLAATENLAWQERKAASFTISPFHAGSAALGEEGAYRSVAAKGRAYGGRDGISLGTAMAISGAAASPNMGYYTSPGISFLMTLFNVRLGWWLANPANDKAPYWRTAPESSLRPLLQEMFGRTSEAQPWVLLSDGGHFDNIGLYEMVRRRCRTIVVVDAGADPGCNFVDLARSITKIWVDLGVRIDFKDFDHLRGRFMDRPIPAKPAPYWSVGRIRYSASDTKYAAPGATVEDGLLLYLKSGLHGTEPVEILSYGLTHSTFPNDSTMNQFYQETQFETYRALGFEIANRAMMAAGVVGIGGANCTASAADRTLTEIIEELEKSDPANLR